ncbi:GNAT family N-acetyltransferase [Nesterenkonia xinjiangensis]|uniref:GNAT superfamily N-acetyltransferase n=1 Tax=Nesterenkonia xinjiangensis TaxID=225327 RepID=A0A7Z0GMS0_9MICC|nr:GNAT family N-acetyltransferase [Nesterenkonia xinjiangensis]NYJ78855.1 GNAT superfamily N-acetyltransferase [Nesterenkonia xinjiangensis]
MSTTHDTDRLTLESGLTVRPWAEGDDLALLQVWGDPENAMHHQDRALLRPSSNDPWSRCIVAEDQGVPVAAATILRSSLHPDKLSFYAEVAPDHRRRGVAAELLAVLEVEAGNCSATGLKARCAKRSAAQCFLKDNGFSKIQTTRRIVVQAGALRLPDLEGTGLDLQEIATGSVELSGLVAEYYNAVHDWDRAEMTIGKAQQLLLDDTTGASGAVILRDVSEDGDGAIRAFAVSYTPERTEDPADVLIGWNPELGETEAEDHVRSLLALLAARYPVELEVDDSMAPLKVVTEELVADGDAEVDFEAIIYAR